LFLVRSDHPIDHDAETGTDVFDMSCPDAQRLFSASKKNKRREANISPQLTLPIVDFQLPIALL
jgi:hypothetical protein